MKQHYSPHRLLLRISAIMHKKGQFLVFLWDDAGSGPWMCNLPFSAHHSGKHACHICWSHPPTLRKRPKACVNRMHCTLELPIGDFVVQWHSTGFCTTAPGASAPTRFLSCSPRHAFPFPSIRLCWGGTGVYTWTWASPGSLPGSLVLKGAGIPAGGLMACCHTHCNSHDFCNNNHNNNKLETQSHCFSCSGVSASSSPPKKKTPQKTNT